MTALGQSALIQHLVDKDSLEVVVREGLDLACIPDEDLRKVFVWAVDYFHNSGRLKAPSQAAIRTEWGDLLDDQEIDLEHEPEESIEWALDDLKASYVHSEASTFNRKFAKAMAEAATGDRLDVLGEAATDLISLSMRMENHETNVDARHAMADRLMAYEAREADRGAIYGMRFGDVMLDEYTRGIHPGEVACMAAGPKTGKSFLLAKIALGEWRSGQPTALYTLENSVEMTLDRMACLAAGVPGSKWNKGECSSEEIEKVMEQMVLFATADVPLYVLQPSAGKRSVEHIVRDAQVRGCRSLLIDQLTFLEPPDTRIPRHLQIRDMTHTLKVMCSTGRERMSCLIAHQISREGMKAAYKLGYHDMTHLAEGSEVERTMDWVWSLYQSREMRKINEALLQTLAVRREDYKHFTMTWAPGNGIIKTDHEREIEDQ